MTTQIFIAAAGLLLALLMCLDGAWLPAALPAAAALAALQQIRKTYSG